MRSKASKDSAQLTRGVAPLTAYPKALPPPERGKIIAKGVLSADKNGIFIFTDGSGGAEGSDVHLRRCGRAYIQMEVGTHRLLTSCAGVLEGPVQTVTRAELTAFAQALRFTPPGLNLAVISDSAYVVNEYAKLERVIFPSKHRDMWPVVRRSMKARPDRIISCLK